MKTVYIISEGKTESSFVQNLLAAELGQQGLFLLPVQIGRRRRGGNVSFERLLSNIRAQLYSNRDAYCTTFVDFYGIDDDFPGKKEAGRKSSLSDKQGTVCVALEHELTQELDEGPMRRFIPYVQMHEFEGLLFSDPRQLAIELRRQDLEPQFRAIRHDFETPEHIDDSPVSAPSKRIQKLFPPYRKVQMGERVARAITLHRIRQECPLFNDWLSKLENLPPLPS